ncbi:MAG: fibronectin type III domain-containing protein [Acutalibacteraceae bacterium]
MKRLCKLKYGISYIVVFMMYFTFEMFTGTAYAAQTLEISLKSVDGNTVSISWNEIDTATEYQVYVSMTEESEPELISSTADTQYTHTDLQCGKTYYYQIIAINEEDELATSEINAVTVIPKAPELNKATASNSVITLSWGEIADADGYIIYRSTEDNIYTMREITGIYDGTVTTFSDNTALPSTQYYYTVCSFVLGDDISTYSEFSNTIKAPVSTFNTPKITATEAVTPRSIKITWQDSYIPNGYYVYRSETKTSNWVRIATIMNGEAREYTDTTAIPTKTYYYTIRSYTKISGEIYRSSYVKTGVQGSTSMGTLTLKSAVSVGATSIKVSWNKINGVDGYYVYRSENLGKSWTRIAQISGAILSSYTDTTAVFNTQYTYTVRAFVKADSVTYRSGYNRSGVTCKAALVRPVITSAESKGCTSIIIQWSKSAGASGYYLYRSEDEYTGWTKIATLKGDSTVSYDDSDVTVNKQYYYTIRAYKSYNGKTYTSTRKTQGVPGKAEPLVPEVTPVTWEYNSVRLTWNKIEQVDGYYIYRTVNSDNTGWKLIKNIKGNSITKYYDEDLECGTKYYYTMRSYKKINGVIVRSTYVKYGTECTPIPPKPNITAGRQKDNSVVVTWAMIKGADSYAVYRREQGGAWSKIYIAPSNEFYYVDNPEYNGVVYEYAVRAVCGKTASKYFITPVTDYLSVCNFDIDYVLTFVKSELGKNGKEMGYTTDWCAFYVNRLLQKVNINLGYTPCPDDVVIKAVNADKGVYYSFREKNITTIRNQLNSVGLSNIVNTDRTKFTPQKGDIVIFLWKGDESKYNWSHIGIATDLRGNYLYTVEGNTSNNITAFEDDDYDKLVVADRKRLYLSDNSEIVGILRMK